MPKIGKYGEPQKCFSDGVYVYCNFVMRNGVAVYSSNGWLKFFAGAKKEQQEEEEKHERTAQQE